MESAAAARVEGGVEAGLIQYELNIAVHVYKEYYSLHSIEKNCYDDVGVCLQGGVCHSLRQE